jgi:transposase-like protein
MKQPIGLSRRIYLAIRFIKNPKSKGFLIEYCPRCGSILFDLENESSKNGIYKARYVCKECGATGDAKERWSEKKEG